MIIYTMAVNNTAYLKKPDKIQIISGENITEYLNDIIKLMKSLIWGGRGCNSLAEKIGIK